MATTFSGWNSSYFNGSLVGLSYCWVTPLCSCCTYAGDRLRKKRCEYKIVCYRTNPPSLWLFVKGLGKYAWVDQKPGRSCVKRLECGYAHR